MAQRADSPTLIIFDVDGTLLDANAVDNDCFDRAFRANTGVGLTSDHWSQFDEVTAEAIVAQALGKSRPDLSELAIRIKDSFLTNLHASHRFDPNAIRAFAGALNLIAALRKNPAFRVAIATGCWRETAQFKLKAAGFELADIPFASASDCPRRADIISLAAERAEMPVDTAVYVGDGLWDLKATRQLGIPFIGVGRKIEALRKSGAEHTLERLEAEALAQMVRRIWKVCAEDAEITEERTT